VAVEAEGPGVPEHAGDIFTRRRSNVDGSGIGLHLARTLATAHAGRLVLARRSPPRFELRLRRAEDPADGPAA
jgi:nitrogen-specific signal transduction histidine kinase